MSIFRIRNYTKKIAFNTLAKIDKSISQDYRLLYSPTFVIGPPRSGSTLTMQLITWAIPTSYFSNITTSSFQTIGYPAPFVTAKIAKWFRMIRQNPTFESYEGNMQGRWRSTEGTDIWSYWFGSRRGVIGPNDISDQQQRSIYKAVAATERAFDLPFMNKTINLSLRIRALVKIFPMAIFIQIKRDPVNVAQSILKIRKGKHDHGYFGSMPKECEEKNDLTLIEQVCRQVYNIDKSIAFEKSTVGEHRFLPVSYKDICYNPLRVLEKIVEFMNSNGSPAKITREVPPSFNFSAGCKVDRIEYDKICSCLDSLYNE